MYLRSVSTQSDKAHNRRQKEIKPSQHSKRNNKNVLDQLRQKIKRLNQMQDQYRAMERKSIEEYSFYKSLGDEFKDSVNMHLRHAKMLFRFIDKWYQQTQVLKKDVEKYEKYELFPSEITAANINDDTQYMEYGPTND